MTVAVLPLQHDPAEATRVEQLPRERIKSGRPVISNKPRTGRARARYKDGHPANNDQANIAFLCRRCHMHVDGRASGALRRDTCRNGHPRTTENTYVSPRGQRACLDCKRAREGRA